MNAQKKLETLAPPLPCALATAFVVYMPSGGGYRLAAAILGIGFVLAACGARRQEKAVYRLCVALAAGLALGLISQFKANAALAAGGGGFLQKAGPDNSIFPLNALEGQVVSDARRTAGGLTYAELAVQAVLGLDQARVSASGRLTVFVRGSVDLPRGSTLVVQCQPPAQLHPATSARVFVDQADVQELLPAPWADKLRLGLRNNLLSAFSRAGGEAGPLLEALFLGVRDELDSDFVGAFRDAGCAHILALSGQHVGILAGLAAVLLGPLLGKSWARPAACFLAALYLIIVGPSPSVIRAIFMFWVATALVTLDRPQKASTILSLVFLLTAQLDPLSVLSLSFQLSYLAVAGIAFFAPGIDFFIRKWIPPAGSGVLAVGLASLAATAPLSILVFGRLNLFSPLVSAIAGILVSCLMWLGAFLVPLVAILPGLQPVVNFILTVPFTALSWLMTAAARLPALEFVQTLDRVAASASVALMCALVYAWPHARYHYQRTRQRSACEFPFPGAGIIRDPRTEQ